MAVKVNEKARCIIISGSPECDIDFISQTVKKNDFVICADKGYYYAKKAGVIPNIAVGDFDSYGGEVCDCEVIRLNPHKDDTDTIHSIDVAFERGYEDIVLINALGGRFDHSFSNISALQYIASKGGSGTIVSSAEHIEYLVAGRYSYDNLCGRTFSLFPFGCDRVCVSYQGAEYPLDRYYLESNYPMGISNVFTSDNSVVEIYDGNAIIIINAELK